jgi:hypothetical protein
MSVYHTVFMPRAFGPAEARCQAEKQGLRLNDLRHTRAMLLIAAGAREARTGPARALQHHTTLNPYGHVLSSTEAALVDARYAIYEQCDEGDDAAGAQGS